MGGADPANVRVDPTVAAVAGTRLPRFGYGLATVWSGRRSPVAAATFNQVVGQGR